MKLIQINPEHYIVVDDSEIKIGDWYYKKNLNVISQKHYPSMDGDVDLKITHSTPIRGLPAMLKAGVKELSLSEVEELINGYSVEKLASKYSKKLLVTEEKRLGHYWGYMIGFNTHKEIVKDKLFTVEDMIESFKMGLMGLREQRLKDYMQPKTEWEVEFVDSKLQLV